MDQQYSELARDIPYRVHLGDDLPKDEECVNPLCNEQAHYQKQGWISRDTWQSWEQGIIDNLKKPGIAAVWKEVKDRASGSFSHLESLEYESGQ